jgi:putative membrane protein
MRCRRRPDDLHKGSIVPVRTSMEHDTMSSGNGRKCRIAAIAGATLMCTAAVVQARGPDSTTASQVFVKEAIQGDLAEIQIGRLAQRKGASDGVKQFGQTLESDHTAGLQKAKSLAASLGMMAPSAPNAKQKSTYNQLSRLSGRRFDRQLAKRMVKDHEKDVQAFRLKRRKIGPAAEFARQTLPTLEAHLKQAKSLSGYKT